MFVVRIVGVITMVTHEKSILQQRICVCHYTTNNDEIIMMSGASVKVVRM